MRIIIIFLIVVFIIAALSNLGQFLTNGKINFQEERASEKQVLSESSGLAAIAEQGNGCLFYLIFFENRKSIICTSIYSIIINFRFSQKYCGFFIIIFFNRVIF